MKGLYVNEFEDRQVHLVCVDSLPRCSDLSSAAGEAVRRE
jgi:hypothetical protein